jgi:hypothetical protein
MRINVVKENGGRVDIGSALMRNFLRTVDARSICGCPLHLSGGAAVVWRTSKKQRVGNLAVKTVAIKV